MSKDRKIIDELFNLAVDNSSRELRTSLSACIVKKGKKIAFGFNQMKSHPFQAEYGKNDQSIFWHAETHCIFNALRRGEDLTGSTLYVSRAKKTKPRGKWVFGLSQPCPGCIKAIIDHGIDTVVFTTDDNTLLKMKITDK